MKQKRDWDDLGEMDAFWAVLSDPKLRYGKWDINEFFSTGERVIEKIMRSAERLGYPSGRDLALDFGCGVGRLTRPLSRHFQRCYGIDISERMIDKAREINQSVPNCEFTVNTENDLRVFPDDHFDMICSFRVLQHVPGRRVIRSYISEFVRTLEKNGLLVFQLPCHIPRRRRIQPRRRAYGLLRALGFSKRFLHERLRLSPIRMSFISEDKITAFLDTLGAQVLETQPDLDASPVIRSTVYYATKS